MPSRSSNTSTSSGTAALVGVTAASTMVTFGIFFLWKKWSPPPSSKQFTIATASDLKHNWNATASDVLRIYYSAKLDNVRKKIYVITGTTSGLGKHCALLLGQHTANCHIIMGVRDVQKGQQIKAQIEETSSSCTASVVHLDLTLLQSVRDFAASVLRILSSSYNNNNGTKKLDAIINNAGCFQTSGFTKDGYQITWQTNALAPAFLTELLLPYLQDDGRILNVSSDMHRLCLGDKIVSKCPPTTSGASPWDYALSKACQILHVTHLQNQFTRADSQQRAFAIDPGLVQTNVARNAGSWMKWFEYSVIGYFFLRSIDQGCATYLYCLLAPVQDLDRDSNNNFQKQVYFAACGAKEPKRACTDPDEAEALAELFHKAWGEDGK